MSNNDNAMARFLFAILQQKCLKDIDWNKVAHNPILAQEITNGHAARMRYSRFRAAMLGLEPQRRNRTSANKSRVSKKKKEDSVKPKKEEGDSSSGDGKVKIENTTDTKATTVKSERRSVTTQQPPAPSQPPAPMTRPEMMMKTEPGLAHYSHHTQPLVSASPRIKQERIPINPPVTEASASASAFSIAAPITPNPSSTPTAYGNDVHSRMHMRLLTPCSDSDVTQTFLPHSPAPTTTCSSEQQLLLQQHPHHYQGGSVVAAASPASLATAAAASSPYDFAQCCDTSSSSAASPSPWQAQHYHGHQHLHHGHGHHTHGSGSVYTAGFGSGGGGGGAGGYAHALDGAYAAAFYGGEHHDHGHDHEAASMFRERELEMEMDAVAGIGGGSQAVKREEWEAEGFDGGI
ncbi:hypothetical protein VTK56DRAFT_552 [Thermocarpiscus australiensis]